jgi:MoaA/NifB/PqqE/SkfB family radical SAM enzyme
MSFSNAVAAVSRLADMGVKGITFSGGGEPTVHDDYAAIIEFAYKKGMDVALITNGVKLDTKVLDWLTWVRFSLDAANPFTYKKIKGVSHFSDVLGNIIDAVRYKTNKKLKTTIGVQSVVSEDNFDQTYAIACLADNLGADYFQFRPVEGSIPKFKPEIPKNSLRVKIIDSWYKWEELKSIKRYYNCPAADVIGAVGADLNFYICCHHVGDKSASYGNILTDNVLANRKQVQKDFDYSKCPVACRGSVINKRLAIYKDIDHVNFL